MSNQTPLPLSAVRDQMQSLGLWTKKDELWFLERMLPTVEEKSFDAIAELATPVRYVAFPPMSPAVKMLRTLAGVLVDQFDQPPSFREIGAVYENETFRMRNALSELRPEEVCTCGDNVEPALRYLLDGRPVQRAYYGYARDLFNHGFYSAFLELPEGGTPEWEALQARRINMWNAKASVQCLNPEQICPSCRAALFGGWPDAYFWYKPTGLRLTWVHEIGCQTTGNIPVEFQDAGDVILDCLGSLGLMQSEFVQGVIGNRG